MAEFTLPKNSKLTKGNEYDISDGSKITRRFLFIDGIQMTEIDRVSINLPLI